MVLPRFGAGNPSHVISLTHVPKRHKEEFNNITFFTIHFIDLASFFRISKSGRKMIDSDRYVYVAEWDSFIKDCHQIPQLPILATLQMPCYGLDALFLKQQECIVTVINSFVIDESLCISVGLSLRL